jgi:hypothetical protein
VAAKSGARVSRALYEEVSLAETPEQARGGIVGGSMSLAAGKTAAHFRLTGVATNKGGSA